MGLCFRKVPSPLSSPRNTKNKRLSRQTRPLTLYVCHAFSGVLDWWKWTGLQTRFFIGFQSRYKQGVVRTTPWYKFQPSIHPAHALTDFQFQSELYTSTVLMRTSLRLIFLSLLCTDFYTSIYICICMYVLFLCIEVRVVMVFYRLFTFWLHVLYIRYEC